MGVVVCTHHTGLECVLSVFIISVPFVFLTDVDLFICNKKINVLLPHTNMVLRFSLQQLDACWLTDWVLCL